MLLQPKRSLVVLLHTVQGGSSGLAAYCRRHQPPTGTGVCACLETHRKSLTPAGAAACVLLLTLQVEEEDDFAELVNAKTKFEAAAVGDLNMAACKKGDIIQLERKGYYIVDQPYGGSPDQPAVLFNIPDGRTKNLGLVAEAQ